MFGKTGSHSRLVRSAFLPPSSYWRGSFLSVLHLCCQSVCKHKEIWTNMPCPNFLTRDVHHCACSLFLAFFLCLTVYSGKLTLSEHWCLTTPLFFTAVSYSTLGMFVDHPALCRHGFQTSAIPNNAAVNNHVHTSFHTGADACRGEIPRSTAPPFLPGKLLLTFWHPQSREPDIRRGMSRELQEARLPSLQSW